jgi:hypothetical protein
MTSKKSHNDLYWDAKKKSQIKDEYKSYLDRSGEQPNPDNAQAFAAIKIDGGFDYLGMSERDLILLLAGKLPYMYD